MRKKRNTQAEIVETLTEYPFITENQIMREAFGYSRKHSYASNKKYADLLRRTLKTGKIDRIEKRVAGRKERFFYFVPK